MLSFRNALLDACPTALEQAELCQQRLAGYATARMRVAGFPAIPATELAAAVGVLGAPSVLGATGHLGAIGQSGVLGMRGDAFGMSGSAFGMSGGAFGAAATPALGTAPAAWGALAGLAAVDAATAPAAMGWTAAVTADAAEKKSVRVPATFVPNVAKAHVTRLNASRGPSPTTEPPV